jgi:hypothetical protein
VEETIGDGGIATEDRSVAVGIEWHNIVCSNVLFKIYESYFHGDAITY